VRDFKSKEQLLSFAFSDNGYRSSFHAGAVQSIFYSVFADGSWPVYYTCSACILPAIHFSRNFKLSSNHLRSNQAVEPNNTAKYQQAQHEQHSYSRINQCLEFNNDVHHKRAGKFIKHFKFKSSNLSLQLIGLQQSEIGKIVSNNNRPGKTTQSPRSSSLSLIYLSATLPLFLEIYSPGIKKNQEKQGTKKNKDKRKRRWFSENVIRQRGRE